MLDPWIIEEIRRREDQRRERDARRLEIPLYDDREPAPAPEADTDDTNRGVVVIDM